MALLAVERLHVWAAATTIQRLGCSRWPADGMGQPGDSGRGPAPSDAQPQPVPPVPLVLRGQGAQVLCGGLPSSRQPGLALLNPWHLVRMGCPCQRASQGPSGASLCVPGSNPRLAQCRACEYTARPAWAEPWSATVWSNSATTAHRGSGCSSHPWLTCGGVFGGIGLPAPWLQPLAIHEMPKAAPVRLQPGLEEVGEQESHAPGHPSDGIQNQS